MAITYAPTFGAARAVFFGTYSGSRLPAQQRPRISLRMGTLVLASAVASCARILLTAATMSGDLAGMFDMTFTRMILGAGEGIATGIRMAGLGLAALVLRLSPALR